MKWLLQLCLLVVATILLSGRYAPAEAQRYYRDDDSRVYSNPYQPRYRSRRRVRVIRRRVRPRNARDAKSRATQIGRIKRKTRRIRVRRNTRKKKIFKRKIASLNKRTVRRKKSARRKKKETIKDVGKGPVQIVVSLPKQRVSIYKGGKVIATSRVSTGKLGHRTPSGVFSIIQKHKDHFSNLYNAAPMPFMQRITWSGIALHAGNVSRPYASHGCIRMPYGFARKLFKRTSMGAHVIVASSPSSPRFIHHDNLFQPSSKGTLMVRSGLRTAALEDPFRLGDADPELSFGGLPDFVRPVDTATDRLGELERRLETAIAAGPALEEALAEAKQDLEERQTVFLAARKNTVGTRKALRKPRLLVRKIKKQRARALRTLKKAERRAKWARLIVEKRRDNPKFEGNWMTNALARTTARELIVDDKKGLVDEITVRLDEATSHYDALRDEDRKARELQVLRKKEASQARILVKTARKEIRAGKRSVKKAMSDVLGGRRGVKSAIAREKQPLRILVTAGLGRERVKDVQKMLIELGYQPGPIDGSPGSRTKTAVKAFQRDLDQKTTGMITDKLVDDLYNRVGRIQKASAHMYVRQGFVDLFDVPVEIIEPTKPLGTHVYTAMHFEENAGSTSWTALTVKDATLKRAKIRRGSKKRRKKTSPLAGVAARKALDRLLIPGAVRRQLSLLLTPGSSMVISDNGISRETGKGTDFVVLTK